MTPSYWRQASAELAAADECMGELVERYAGLGLVSRGDPFATLVTVADGLPFATHLPVPWR